MGPGLIYGFNDLLKFSQVIKTSNKLTFIIISVEIFTFQANLLFQAPEKLQVFVRASTVLYTTLSNLNQKTQFYVLRRTIIWYKSQDLCVGTTERIISTLKRRYISDINNPSINIKQKNKRVWFS